MILEAFATSSTFGLLIDSLLFFTAWAHVLLAPYTKVEESFNLHATHDVLAYGVTPSALSFYDHFVFPGVVPRTFIGSVVLAGGSYIPLRVATSLGLIQSKFDVQILIRLVLATANAAGLSIVRRAVQRRFGASTSALFAILTCTQFHLPFWIGRTLPNMFALLPVNMATSLFVHPGSTPITVRRHYRTILCMIGSAAIIFRSELVLLVIPIFVAILYQYTVPFTYLIPYGTGIAMSSIASTILVDSYFWNAWNPPLWPELSGIFFNVYEGKSSDWGTSPYHAYLTHHLPKLLLASLPLAVFACIPSTIVAWVCAQLRIKRKGHTANESEQKDGTRRLDAMTARTARGLLAPSLAFVLLISGLGHKEWRFVVYVVPMVNVVAAVGAKRLITLPNRPIRILGQLALVSLIVGNVLATAILTIISRANYPGGAAMALLNDQSHHVFNASVHIDNLAAQTGASLFTQEHSPPYFYSTPKDDVRWTYSKEPAPESFSAYTYLVTEHPEAHTTGSDGEWDMVGSVDAAERVDIRQRLNALVTKPTLFILRNKSTL